MWQEIQEQPAVAQRLLQAWLGTPAGAAPQAGLLAQCRDELRRADRVVLAGTGASLAACRAGLNAFVRCGSTLPHVVPAADLPGLAAKVLGPESLVILVSQSGESLETRTAAEALKARGVPLWGITNNPDSYLARAADRALPLHAGEEVSSATKTYLATLLLLMLLAGAGRCLDRVPADLAETLRRSEEPVGRWAAALEGEPVGYILGLGATVPVAAQGALLLKEKTFKHVEGLSLSEFRHGNIEVMRPGLPLLLLAPTPRCAAEAVRHGAYLASLGAAVFLVTDSPVQGMAPDRVLQVQNRGDELLGALQVLPPLQLLAERIARQQGYDVDGFRYIAKVVEEYKL